MRGVQVWKLSATDLCEIARNSVLHSGFPHQVCVHLLCAHASCNAATPSSFCQHEVGILWHPRLLPIAYDTSCDAVRAVATLPTSVRPSAQSYALHDQHATQVALRARLWVSCTKSGGYSSCH